MWGFVKPRLKAYIENTRGNFGAIMAISAPVLLGGIGMAVDYNNLAGQQNSLQIATDVAALTAVTAIDDMGTVNSQKMIAVVTETLESELRNFDMPSTPIVLHDSAASEVTILVSAEIDNYFGGIIRPATSRVTAKTVVEYQIDDDVSSSPSGDANSDIQSSEVEDLRPTSIMFVLDASGSMNARYGGTIDNSDHNGNPRRRNILRTEMNRLLDRFDALRADYPEADEEIRTGTMAFNRGIYNPRSSDLEDGWDRVRQEVQNVSTDNFTLPATAFKEAMDQLNGEDEDVRKVIVLMGDGELDDHSNARIFYDEPESQVLSGFCNQAKSDGIEIYVSTLDLDPADVGDAQAIDIYRQCASVNGTVDDVTADQQNADAACSSNISFAGRAACSSEKSEYFAAAESTSEFANFFNLIPQSIRRVPATSDSDSSDGDNQNKTVQVRLVQ